MNRKPNLFDVYPRLEETMAWTPLGGFPTPVERLSHLGHDKLWIKRDDLSSPVYGGNKVRKLEFILGEALRLGKKRVVTIGGIGTNHGLATAIYARRLGMRCTLILFDQPVTKHVRQNLLLYHRNGADMIHAAGMGTAALRFYIVQKIMSPGAMFIYAGGSSPVGATGFVNAAFELKKQIDEGAMPVPRYIICPLGSNGTMAGLSLGLLLAGLPSEVIGVRVTKASLGIFRFASPLTVKALMVKTLALLKSRCSGIPDVVIREPGVIDEFFGAGYGLPTREGASAMQLFRERQGIVLEPTYTAKTCAGLLDFIRDPFRRDDAILYWHTFNSADLSGDAAAVDYRELPRQFHRFFRGEPVA